MLAFWLDWLPTRLGTYLVSGPLPAAPLVRSCAGENNSEVASSTYLHTGLK